MLDQSLKPLGYGADGQAYIVVSYEERVALAVQRLQRLHAAGLSNEAEALQWLDAHDRGWNAAMNFLASREQR